MEAEIEKVLRLSLSDMRKAHSNEVIDAKLTMERPCAPGIILPDDALSWIWSIRRHNSGQQVSPEETKLRTKGPYTVNSACIDGIIVLLRRLLSLGDITLPSALVCAKVLGVGAEQQSNIETLIELLHHDFGRQKNADFVIKGWIFDLVRPATDGSRLTGEEGIPDIIMRSTLLSTVLVRIPRLLSFRYKTWKMPPQDTLPWVPADTSVDHCRGWQVVAGQAHLNQLFSAPVDSPYFQDGCLKVRNVPGVEFVVLVPGKEPPPKFDDLRVLSVTGHMVEEVEEGDRDRILLKSQPYGLSAVIDLDSSDVRIYDYEVSPLPTKGIQGEWRLGEKDRKYLLVYRRLDDVAPDAIDTFAAPGAKEYIPWAAWLPGTSSEQPMNFLKDIVADKRVDQEEGTEDEPGTDLTQGESP